MVEIVGLPVVGASESIQRLSIFLWGESGAGKTTFACTAPGKKLIISFDPDGYASVGNRSDVKVLDLSGQSHTILDKFEGTDPLNLTRKMEDGTILIDQFDTIILDSVTSAAQKALEAGVHKAAKRTKGEEPPTMEFPGMQGYGARTARMITVLTSLLAVTQKYKKNFIAITHEDDPSLDKQGNVLFITMMLGGKLKNNVNLRMSEVWHIREHNGKRFIAIRPCRSRVPMKTRMFVTNGNPEFELKYNPNVPDEDQEHTITNWFNQWIKNETRKLELPK